MSSDIRSFRIDVPQADLDDLRDRLRRTRWGQEIPGQGWTRGVPVDYLKNLAAYWADGFDWRAQEARINDLPHYITEIDGQVHHFAHIPSANPDATPLLLVHDWPASFVMFLEVVQPLTADFHLVLTNLPGVGYSAPLTSTGWSTARIAGAFVELMARLGYERYGVQGTGGGAAVAVEMGRRAPAHVLGIHVNGHLTFPSDDPADYAGLTDAEQDRLGRLQRFRDDMMGFNIQQSTRPQTLAHGLTDSPVGQLAWIVEKFKEWTDPTADLPEDAVDRDLLLTNVSLYWFTGSAGPSANLYFEAAHDPNAWSPKERSAVPTGVALAPTDITIRRYAERESTITHWTELDRGGNFLAMEQPAAYAADVRTFFTGLK